MKLQMLKPRKLGALLARVPVLQPGSWRADKQSSTQRGYNYQWQQARAGYLLEHPLCVYCSRAGRVTLATVLDHINPHRGDMAAFWDKSNWQGLCKAHHDGAKQAEEREAERCCTNTTVSRK